MKMNQEYNNNVHFEEMNNVLCLQILIYHAL